MFIRVLIADFSDSILMSKIFNVWYFLEDSLNILSQLPLEIQFYYVQSCLRSRICVSGSKSLIFCLCTYLKISIIKNPAHQYWVRKVNYIRHIGFTTFNFENLSILNRQPKKPTDTDLLKLLYNSLNIKKSTTKFKISAAQIDRECNCEEFKKKSSSFLKNYDL